VPVRLAGEAPGGFWDGLAAQVEANGFVDVDGDPFDGAAGEAVGRVAGMVVGNGGAVVAADAEALTSDLEAAWLGLDPGLAELVVSVIERRDVGGYTGGLFAVLIERGGQDEVVAGR
jgi:hypothetical protein